jgi:hypothetical protein
MADDQMAALGTTGHNTISRAELGAYYRRQGLSRAGNEAAAVFDDIAGHREPYEPAGETGAPAAPSVAADLTSAQCEALRRLADEWGEAIGAVRSAVNLLGARIHSAEDARVIAGARGALKVLEGAETPAGGTDTRAPAPASPESSAAATRAADAIRIRMARALYDSTGRCARCKVCEHQCGAAANVAVEAVSAERERAEARLAEVRAVLLEGGQDAGTVRRRALEIIGSEEGAGHG